MGNSNIFQVVSIIEALPYYETLFVDAFGDKLVTAKRIANALSQFMRSMLSFSSKFDRGIALDFANFNAQENLGRALFNSDRTQCSACHSTVLQLLNRQSNGLHPESLGLSTASLRNAGVRKFFERGGVFPSLKSMLVHYNRVLPECNDPGGQPPPLTLCSAITNDSSNPLNVDGSVLEMNLRPDEEDAIISFIKTLSDPILPVSIDENGNNVINTNSLLFEKKYSDPFFQLLSPDMDRFVDINPSILLLLDD